MLALQSLYPLADSPGAMPGKQRSRVSCRVSFVRLEPPGARCRGAINAATQNRNDGPIRVTAAVLAVCGSPEAPRRTAARPAPC